MRRLVLGWSLVFAIPSCVDVPDGRFRCETTEDCPSGQTCSANICRKHPELGSSETTGPNTQGQGSEVPDSSVDNDTGIEPPCVVVEGEAEQNAIFVSLAGSPALNCGDAKTPCQTIGLGITRAGMAGRSKVIIAAGEYPETVTLSAGITLQGGWSHVGDRFSRQCVADRASTVVIASPTSKGVTASYEGTSTLDTLTVRTQAPAAGESRYALFVTGASTELTLNDVHAEASAGGDGASGAAGATGEAASGTCTDAAGATGAEGAAGTNAAAGVFRADGYVADNGQQGTAGSKGLIAMAGEKSCAPCVAEGGTCDASASCTPTATNGESCALPGPSGCGGGPGGGGLGGQSGGSSVALFVVDSKVTAMNSVLRAANGGAGGAGGVGGNGGTGADGELGQVTGSCRLCKYTWLPISNVKGDALPIGEGLTPHLPPIDIPILPKICAAVTSSVAAVRGGKGGVGGTGGRGGDGAAGSSFAVYLLGSGAVNTMNVKLMHGEPGAATSTGTVGQSGPMNGP